MIKTMRGTTMYSPMRGNIGKSLSVFGGFDPRSIPYLALWLDANDASTITETSGSVSQWNDKSGNNSHATQSTGAAQPITGTRTANGLNALDFDGTDDFMDLPSSLYTGLGEGNNTMFFVFKNDAPDDQQRYISGFAFGGGSTRYGLIYSLTLGSDISGFNASSFDPVNLDTITADTDTHIDGVTRNGSNVTVFRDGSTHIKTEVKGSNVTVTGMRLGANGTPSEFLHGALCEILIYKKALTDAEKNLVGNYLATKWGITWANI